VARHLLRRERYKYICVNLNVDTCNVMRNG
jgi:hypothetical protein